MKFNPIKGILILLLLFSEVLRAAPQNFFYRVNIGKVSFSNMEKDDSKNDLIKEFYQHNGFQCTSAILVNMKKMMNSVQFSPEYIKIITAAGENSSSIKLGLELYCLDSARQKDQMYIPVGKADEVIENRNTCSKYILEPVLYEFPLDEEPIRISRLYKVSLEKNIIIIKNRRTNDIRDVNLARNSVQPMKDALNYCQDPFFLEEDFHFLIRDGIKNYQKVRNKILSLRKKTKDKLQKFSCEENPKNCN